MRNALAHVPKGQHTMVAAAIRQGTVRNFVRRLGMIGEKEPDNATPQRTSHT